MSTDKADAASGVSHPDLPATMFAARLRHYGGPDSLVYEEAPVPAPDAHEVLIRVQAAGVNPFDLKVREGKMQEMMPLQLPVPLGTDVAGVIVAVGKEVSNLKVGQHVYGVADMAKGGSYAQYAIAQSGSVAHKPGALSAVEAASAPVVAMTAWQALHDVGRIQSTSKVLIHGAGGMVGLFAIQFARRVGCHIVALSRHENTHLIREMGADTVLDYTKVAFEEHVSGIDVVLDTIGGDIREKSWRTLKPGGILVAFTDPPSQEEAEKYGVRASMMQMKPSGFLLSDFSHQLNDGQLRTFVGQVFPLARAADALEALHNHIPGKVVLDMTV